MTQTIWPEAGQPLHISIGRVPLSLFIPEEALQRQAIHRYQQFTGNLQNGLPVYLKAESAVEDDTGKFSYVLDDASMMLDSTRAEFSGVRHEYALDSLLRILLTVVLLPERGFLLHAASVVRDSRAFVFVGRSGAGKSTIASLSPAGSVLTDEISLLRFTDGCWQAHGTPFWGEFRAAGMNRHFPIGGIYSLVQAREDRIERMSPREILRALLPCVLFFTTDKHASEELLRLLLGIAEQVPCFRLHFRRGNNFWKVIAA